MSATEIKVRRCWAIAAAAPVAAAVGLCGYLLCLFGNDAAPSPRLQEAATEQVVSLAENLDPGLVFFASVPKTGSATMKMLLREVSRMNSVHFSHNLLKTNETNYPHSPTFEEQAWLVQQLVHFSRPLIYKQGVHFINFSWFGDFKQPSYFGVVRSPLERFRSRFNFVRNKSPQLKISNMMLYEPGALEGKNISEWKKMTLEECALDHGDRECWPRVGDKVDHQLSYFCGCDPGCSEFGSAESLARAKDNVARFYPTVGILERLGETLRLMEAKLPEYINGISFIYTGQKKHLSTVETAPLSPLAEENLKGWVLAQDIDFYAFVTQRMNDQLRTLEKIPKT